MNDHLFPAIQVVKLSKAYNLYKRHSDRLKEALHPFRKKYHREFFALRNVSFEVSKGEALGILGRNGTGKSTLLKIVTGVLTPTSGKIKVHGSVSAILELGAGFNQEMTGMENIYFRGTLLGREPEETERMIPDILTFADIGEFINQPVKTYSSGMFARLSFALAVNVNPDILIVDEALSVGDMRFQQKCIRKMEAFRDEGKTVLLVTHNINMVNKFCNRALWLDQGQVKEIGPAESVCKHYAVYMAYGDAHEHHPPVALKSTIASSAPEQKTIPWLDLSGCESFGTGDARIVRAALLESEKTASVGIANPGQRLRLIVEVRANRPIEHACCGILLKNRLGQSIFALNNWYSGQDLSLEPGQTPIKIMFTFRFPSLTHGRYAFSLGLAEGSLQEHVQHHFVHDALFVDLVGGAIVHGSDCIMALPEDTWSMQWEVEQ